MGRDARLNPRSPDGGKPHAYCAFQRCVRAVKQFQDDRVGFTCWLDDRPALSTRQREAMERIWSELHPAPRVTLHTLSEMDAHAR